jgi:hypothetical protein
LIYSKEHDFIFVKGKKVAGTSVEIALAGICGPDDIITPITPVDERERLKLAGRGAQNYSTSPEREQEYLERVRSARDDELAQIVCPSGQFKNHMSLTAFAKRFGAIPSQRVFCVERSPYAKIISSANMSGNFEHYKRGTGKMSLDVDRIKRVIKRRFDANNIAFCKNIDLYRDPSGCVNIRVLRYEFILEDFASLMAEYGILNAPTLPHAKRGADSNAIDPTEIFTRDQIDRINEAYADEFDQFHYARF